jgi:hypothetical protein
MSQETQNQKPESNDLIDEKKSYRYIAPAIIILIIITLIALTKFQNRSLPILTGNQNLYNQSYQSQQLPYFFQPFTTEQFIEAIDTQNNLLISKSKGSLIFSNAQSGEIFGQITELDLKDITLNKIFTSGSRIFGITDTALLELDRKGKPISSTTLPSQLNPNQILNRYNISQNKEGPLIFRSNNGIWTYNIFLKHFENLVKNQKN